jgi:GNAT superfamily N-acetyltransferase
MGYFRFFRPVSTWEAFDTIDADWFDPEDYIYTLSDNRMGGSLLDDVEDMATDLSDRTNAWARCSEQAEYDYFTIGLAHADDPDQIISMITVGVEAQGRHLTGNIQMVFTDAEFRGEGYGRLISGAAIVMLQRAVRQWDSIPGAEGDMPESVQVIAETVSDGGSAIVSAIEDAMEVYLDAFSEDLEPA